MSDRAQAYGIDVPRNKCEECGYWFTTAGDERVCPDCLEGQPKKKRNAFDAFLSDCVSDCVNARLGGPMSAEEYLALSPEEKAEDARIVGERAMERRDLLTPDGAAAYSSGIHEEPKE